MVTPALFAAYPTPEKMAKATPQELFEIIKSISFPNNKARNLAAMAKMLVEQHNGIVPPTVEEIEQLPGCGHKTANVVAYNLWGSGNCGGYACLQGIAQNRILKLFHSAWRGEGFEWLH